MRKEKIIIEENLDYLEAEQGDYLLAIKTQKKSVAFYIKPNSDNIMCAVNECNYYIPLKNFRFVQYIIYTNKDIELGRHTKPGFKLPIKN